MDWTGVRTRRAAYDPPAVIFTQGEAAGHVLYLVGGSVRLSVLSPGGKEAVVEVLGGGTFFGESCLAGQPRRTTTATAMATSVVLVIEHDEMQRQLRERPAFADGFLSHMLARNIRIEEDLLDQLFNSTEKRLARTLLMLARDGDGDVPLREVPKVTQELLAEMVGTTRSRVNLFMNKFRRLGFIDYNGTLTVHDSLLTVILRD